MTIRQRTRDHREVGDYIHCRFKYNPARFRPSPTALARVTYSFRVDQKVCPPCVQHWKDMRKWKVIRPCASPQWGCNQLVYQAEGIQHAAEWQEPQPGKDGDQKYRSPKGNGKSAQEKPASRSNQNLSWRATWPGKPEQKTSRFAEVAGALYLADAQDNTVHLHRTFLLHPQAGGVPIHFPDVSVKPQGVKGPQKMAGKIWKGDPGIFH